MTDVLGEVLLPLAGASVFATAALTLVHRLLSRWQVVDVPNARSSHDRPVLRGGGLAPAAAIVLGWAGLAASGVPGRESDVLAWAALAVALYAALGWYEDVRGLHAGGRAAGQLLLAALATTVLAFHPRPQLWLCGAAVIALASFVNVTNFMDGINGISGLFGAVTGLSYAVLGLVENARWLTVGALVVAAAFASFLPWNARAPRMFLGDVGSYALGAALGSLGLAAVFAGLPLPAVVAPVTVYLADTSMTLVRRVLAGEKWYEAHRSHVYQRLTQQGLGHLTVATGVAAASAVAAVAGLVISRGGIAAILAATALGLLLVLYLSSPRWVAALGCRRLQVRAAVPAMESVR
jgi:UDP-N-acetylmuramyl pentapeptide phosphotransferase/UDP-N-acetylglucosamine-1-phosphate transferase